MADPNTAFVNAVQSDDAPDTTPTRLPGVLGFNYVPSKEETGAQKSILEGNTKREELAKGYAEDIKPITTELERKLSEPRPKMPTAPVEPPPPSRKIRPFAENTPGEPWQVTTQKVMMNLGLLAEGVAGLATNYPEGALAAMRGSFEGWAAGDKERGDRAWDDWYSTVDQMRHVYAQHRQEVADMIAQHDGDIESLKAKLAVKGIEIGANEKVIEAGQKNPQAILDFADSNFKKGMEVWKQTNELAAKKFAQDHLLEMERQGRERNDIARRRLTQAMTPGADGGMTDEAADIIADVYAKTGKMPALGMGKIGAQNREKVFNSLARMQKEGKVPPGGIPLASANYAADKSALASMRKQEAQILSFERTANSSASYALGLSDKVTRTGSPVFNAWLNAAPFSRLRRT